MLLSLRCFSEDTTLDFFLLLLIRLLIPFQVRVFHSSKSTYSVPIKLVIYKVTALKKEIFNLDRFFQATSYPGLRKLLAHTIRDRLLR